MKLPLVVCLAALAAPLVCRAQAPIRVEVSLVNVGFSVRDEKGNLVTNLTQDDFEITEDGVPQKISFFARSGAPLTRWLEGRPLPARSASIVIETRNDSYSSPFSGCG